MPHSILVRAAEAADVDNMHELLLAYSEQSVLLPRSRDNIFQHLQEFLVAEYDGSFAGVIALHIYGPNLAEIRSLAVSPSRQGLGIGRLLVEASEKWAAGLGVSCIFALTYVADFFAGLGSDRVPKERLPHQIWTVCVHCDKFADCDEIAVRKFLADADVEPAQVVPILEVGRK